MEIRNQLRSRSRMASRSVSAGAQKSENDRCEPTRVAAKTRWHEGIDS